MIRPIPIPSPTISLNDFIKKFGYLYYTYTFINNQTCKLLQSLTLSPSLPHTLRVFRFFLNIYSINFIKILMNFFETGYLNMATGLLL